MKNIYNFCSVCGSKLRFDKKNLKCVKCDFVNYRNPRPTSTVLVFSGSKLLLSKRTGPPFKGWWDLPGGFIDGGEHPEETAAREIKEETGLDIKIESLFGVYTGVYPSRKEPFRIITFVYKASAKGNKLESHDDVSDSRWFRRRDLPPKIAFDSNQKIIRDLIKKWK